MDAVPVIAAAGAVAGAVLVHARIWPHQPCPRCRGRRGRGVGSTDEAWNDCRWCGGSGKRVRHISRIYPKWRDESRRRRK